MDGAGQLDVLKKPAHVPYRLARPESHREEVNPIDKARVHLGQHEGARDGSDAGAGAVRVVEDVLGDFLIGGVREDRGRELRQVGHGCWKVLGRLVVIPANDKQER